MTKVTLVVDLQFGSTGKGLIAGYLAERDMPDTIINANMPNAGHTYINADGRVWMHKVLPNGIVSPNLKHVMLGAGSIFSLDRLREEFEGSADIFGREGVRLVIHQDAVVLHESHAQMERNSMSHISSTMQGSGAALVSKIARNPIDDHRAKTRLVGTEFEDCVVSQKEWLNIVYASKHILAEGAQGYSLGLNSGFWPFCTSRDCTPARFLADCGIPHSFDIKVVGTARVHPIRVGNTADGYSGDVFPDQIETSWAELGVKEELTTVTKRVRRVFTFSKMQITEAMMMCRPDEIFLNFCNYDEETAMEVARIIDGVKQNMKLPCTIQYFGYGPKSTDIIEYDTSAYWSM